MNPIAERLQQVRQQISDAATKYQRPVADIRLLAVSKTQPAEAIEQAFAAGQRAFGESYLQEAMEKIEQLADLPVEWHYIGRVQSNKTRPIAERFQWVHSVDSEKQLRRLNEQRPEHLPPLNVCLQVKLDDEPSKGGLSPDQTGELAGRFQEFPHLRLRGLMTLPAPAEGIERQRIPLRRLKELRDSLATPEQPLDTLSMGMSDDLEAAVAEGSTMVRIGTAIFGPRNHRQ